MSDNWTDVTENFKGQYAKAYAYHAPVWSEHLRENVLCTVGFVSKTKWRDPYQADSLMDATFLGDFRYAKLAKEAVMAHLVTKALRGQY